MKVKKWSKGIKDWPRNVKKKRKIRKLRRSKSKDVDSFIDRASVNLPKYLSYS